MVIPASLLLNLLDNSGKGNLSAGARSGTYVTPSHPETA